MRVVGRQRISATEYLMRTLINDKKLVIITPDHAADRVRADLDEALSSIKRFDPSSSAASSANPVLGIRQSKGLEFDDVVSSTTSSIMRKYY